MESVDSMSTGDPDGDRHSLASIESFDSGDLPAAHAPTLTPESGTAHAKPRSKTNFFAKGLRKIVSRSSRRRNPAQENTAEKSAESARLRLVQQNAPAQMGKGSLSLCPLKPTDYEQAWKDLNDDHWPELHTRLHTTLLSAESDRPALKPFLLYLREIKKDHLLRFYLTVHRFLRHAEEGGVQLQHCTPEMVAKALEIYDTYVSRNASHRVLLPDEMVLQVELALSPENGQVEVSCFHTAVEYVHQELSENYFPAYRKSDLYYKYCISILTSQDLRVDDILLNDEALVCLMEFMEREGAPVLIQFWMSCSHYRQQMLEGLQKEEARSDAMGLYTRYFSLQAKDPLGVDEKTRVDTENNICQEKGPDANCFIQAQHLVYTALRLHYFPAFKISDLFIKYCNELIKASQTKHAYIDPTAASSSSSPHPELADVAKPAERDAEPPAVGDGHLIRHKTALGRVNEWGVYLRDAEIGSEFDFLAEPESKGLTDLVKMAVGKRRKDRKVDQDMALQVSQMIISEVYKDMKGHKTIFEAVRPSSATVFSKEGSVASENMRSAPGSPHAARKTHARSLSHEAQVRTPSTDSTTHDAALSGPDSLLRRSSGISFGSGMNSATGSFRNSRVIAPALDPSVLDERDGI